MPHSDAGRMGAADPGMLAIVQNLELHLSGGGQGDRQEPASPSRETVRRLLDRGFKLVFWSGAGEAKGPKEHGWLERGAAGGYTISDYVDGMRVGIMHGVPLGDDEHVVCDVDIDWADGQDVALLMLPKTQYLWGRKSKPASHLLYTVSQSGALMAYKDVGKNPATLLEFRPDVHQSMAPPSVWQKDGQREALVFRAEGDLAHFTFDELKRRCTLTAIAMLLAKHLGKYGFGHETRLAWAGFLMRLGVEDADLQKMGEALSKFCVNREVDDVRKVIQSTRASLSADGKKVKGGPALAKIIGGNGRAVTARICEWLGNEADFIRDKHGTPVAKNEANIRRGLDLLNVCLSYDQFSDKMLIQHEDQPAKRLDDIHLDAAYLAIHREHLFCPPEDYFRKVVVAVALDNIFHPVRDYLDSLVWDGVPRIDGWLATYGGATGDNPNYLKAVSSLPLMAAVKRIYEPGCQYHEMVVWESPQGMGKSSAARTLCPNSEWFSDDLPLTVDSKQIIERTLGKWIIEASDLAGKRKAELETLKAMLSRPVDGPARMAYGRFATDRPRHFILIGTTNLDTYLQDQTGNRRFWPVKVREFNLEQLAADRDQLWAEARQRVLRGQSIRLPKELWPVAAREQEKRTEVEPWQAPIENLIASIEPSEDGKRRLVTDDIWIALGMPVERRDRRGASTISQIMQTLGYRRTRIYDKQSGETKTGYIQKDDAPARAEGDVEGEVGGGSASFSRSRDETPF
jgi:hypothetical protein